MISKRDAPESGPNPAMTWKLCLQPVEAQSHMIAHVQMNPPVDPWSILTMPDEILNLDDDVCETSLEHNVGPRPCLTDEQIAKGQVTQIERLSEEFNVFVPRLRSEVLHWKKISARCDIQ